MQFEQQFFLKAMHLVQIRQHLCEYFFCTDSFSKGVEEDIKCPAGWKDNSFSPFPFSLKIQGTEEILLIDRHFFPY